MPNAGPWLLLLASLSPILAAGPVRVDPAPVIAHEWGTFTSIAGPDGDAIRWSPLTASSDLPCFVYHYSGWFDKTSYATIRMETPVIYFHGNLPASVSVKVNFPQGLITEWYPRAQVLPSKESRGVANGSIEWPEVNITPGASPTLPSDGRKSHYYAARETAATPLRVQDEVEALLFYRGIGNFSPPLRVRASAGGELDVEKLGAEEIPYVVVFENRSGNAGYQIYQHINQRLRAKAPSSEANDRTIHAAFEEILTQAGLYPDEARAMVETWRDSWFEPGTRVFYIVPEAFVGRVLPLHIHPKPAEVRRVFVGRVEVLSPWMGKDFVAAFEARDVAGLAKWGRLFGPLQERYLPYRNIFATPAGQQFFGEVWARIRGPQNSGSCSVK